LLHEKNYAESYTEALPDFVKLAEAYGAVGIRATTPDELDKKIKEMIKSALTKGPVEEINSAEFVQTRKPIKDKEKNPIDVIKLDVPLLIRLLEYAKEDAQTDMDLHTVAENLTILSQNDRVLDMTDYDSIISPDLEIE
jgi:hypothetical protein